MYHIIKNPYWRIVHADVIFVDFILKLNFWGKILGAYETKVVFIVAEQQNRVSKSKLDFRNQVNNKMFSLFHFS